MHRQLILFGVVGGLGFFVDVVVLYLLNPFFGPFVARAYSFLSAVFVTWVLNRRYTFREQRSNLSLFNEFLSYLSLMAVGGICNYGAYAWLISESIFIKSHLYLGVGIGSLAGMFINFATSRFLIYRNDRAEFKWKDQS